MPAIILSKLKSENGTVFWHIAEAEITFYPFLDYMAHCRKTLSEKTIETLAYNLASWLNYLIINNINYLDASDAALIRYRDSLYMNHSKGGISEKRNINSKLISIYKFYNFIHQNSREIFNLIGPLECNITSNITANVKAKFSDLYPCCFPSVGRRSKHTVKHTPTDNDQADFYAYSLSAHAPYVAKRNCLIVDIVKNVALRKGSVASLTVDQFPPLSDEQLGESFLSITPAVQKLGYSKAFDFPIELYLRIVAHIQIDRKPVIERTGSGSNCLLLNYKTGTPLLTISSIFSRESKSLGWPGNSGLHSWRRKSAQDYLEQELESRLRLGLDTSYDALALSLAEFLGHEDIESQRSYVERVMRRFIKSKSKKYLEEISELKLEIQRLKTEIRILAGTLQPSISP